MLFLKLLLIFTLFYHGLTANNSSESESDNSETISRSETESGSDAEEGLTTKSNFWAKRIQNQVREKYRLHEAACYTSNWTIIIKEKAEKKRFQNLLELL